MSGSSEEEQQLDLSAFSEEESTTTPEEPTEEFPCPWDGCERGFDTRRGVGIHHKSVHGESIGGPHVKVNCAWCGESKMEYPGRVERSENHFCGTECKGQYRRSRPKEEQYNWKGGKVEVECRHCSETKEVWPSRVEERDYFFCDDDCKGSWISENQTGDNHPRWVGGKTFYHCMRDLIGPQSWIMARRKYRESGSLSCMAEGCDWTPREEDKRPHIHHIIPVLNGGTNDSDLLIPLCSPCHSAAEKYTRNKLNDVLPAVYRDYYRDELPEGRVPSGVFRKLCTGVTAARSILQQAESQ